MLNLVLEIESFKFKAIWHPVKLLLKTFNFMSSNDDNARMV
jgi:hypothetical protein